MKETIRIALLDDDSLFVEGIAALLGSNSKFCVQFKTNKPTSFLEYIKETTSLPDIILLDLNMKPINGLEVLDFLNQNQISIKVIVLSSLFNSSIYGYMIKHSISAFLPKYTEKEELFMAIENVFVHNIYVNEANKILLKDYIQLQKKINNPLSVVGLSDRENEVLICICKEMSTKEIGEHLFISVKTVESHRAKLMEKIGCKNVIGMVIYAILNGLHTLSDNKFN